MLYTVCMTNYEISVISDEEIISRNASADISNLLNIHVIQFTDTYSHLQHILIKHDTFKK